MNSHTNSRPMWRLVGLIALFFSLLVGCTSQSSNAPITDDTARDLLIDAVDNFRLLRAFRFDIEQGGVPFAFNFQLGPGQPTVATTMSTAEAAFIAPDIIWASAVIRVQGLPITVGLFAEQDTQWLNPLNTTWIPFSFAEGFNPDSLMGEDSGFTSAISDITELTYVDTIERDETEIVQVQGKATAEVVNTLLFGLITLETDVTEVDVFIDRGRALPIELVLTIPDTADGENEDTFWSIEIYDTNQALEIDAPAGVDTTVELPDEPLGSTLPNWVTPLLYVLGFSAMLGAVVTPLVYQRKGRSFANAIVIGALVGGIGSLVLLIPLWVFIPEMQADDKPIQQVIDQREQLSKINPWVVMGFISIPVFVGSLDLTVVSAFLPELVSDLGLPFESGLDDASWVVTAYLLAYTVSLTFTGRLSDLLGRRVVYVASLLIFIIGSAWVAVSLSFPTDILLSIYEALGQRPSESIAGLQAIIIGRTIQAIGAGALVPVSLALVGDIFPPDKRARPLGFVAAMDTLGWVLGPVYGGVFLQIMSWQGLFWMNVPLTLLALFSILYALRNLEMIKVRGIFDLLGTVLIVGSLSALSIGLGANIDPAGGTTRIEDLQPLPDYALPLVVLSIILLIAFIIVERRVKDPLVNLGMFARKNLASASLVNLFVGYCLFIGLVNVPLLVNLQNSNTLTFTETALQVGAMLSTLTLPMAFAAVPGGWLSDKVGVKQTILLGLILSVIGFTAIWLTWTIDISVWIVAIEMAIVGVGIGLTFSPVSAAIINSAKDSERGVAGAIVLILRLIGMTVSISTLSSIMFYRINAQVAVATAELTTVDPTVIAGIYTETSVQILGEMGLIGAVLSGIAIIPALFIDKVIEMPSEE